MITPCTPCVALIAALALSSAAATPSLAQSGTDRPDTTRVRRLDPINVTATRTPREGFRTPYPVTVADSATARRQPAYSVADLFRSTPGVDITGAGSNQSRLSIRGQRGQRILLLENGIRLNNSRRQQDFGELPALSDVENLERAELVRGPASVLYGTDAIGGVLNLIAAGAPVSGADRVSGAVGYRFSTHDHQQRPTGYLVGRVGALGFRASATYRDTDSYDAPAGTFGGLTLDRPVRVHDSGVQDANYSLELAIPPAAGQRLTARFARYEARRAGFGYVAGADLGTPDAPFIRIHYPEQSFNQLSVRYGASALGSALADRLDITGYYQSNARDLNLDVFVPFGPTAPPGAGVGVVSHNFTDLDTWGTRIEAAKIVGGRHTLTYGADFFSDDSFNTDSSASTVVGFGPPQTSVSTTPPVPNSRFRSAGLFAQATLAVAPRLSMVLGTRFQKVQASTKATPGNSTAPVSSSDATAVWAANLLYELTPTLGLVVSAGRAFRSPNLVERFFDGPTPEGSGYQVRNPGLVPETSINVDIGAKYRSGPAYLEGFYYRSTIRHGIRIEATGEQVGPFTAFRNVNVAKLRDEGVELLGELRFGSGVGVRMGYTYHSAEDALEPTNPVGDTFSSKITAELRYDDPSGRFWLGSNVRHNGTRKDVELGNAVIGSVLPSFTVLGMAGGARLFRHGRVAHSVSLAITNLTNELYAEFSNASFFRPEPGRSVTATYRLGF